MSRISRVADIALCTLPLWAPIAATGALSATDKSVSIEDARLLKTPSFTRVTYGNIMVGNYLTDKNNNGLPETHYILICAPRRGCISGSQQVTAQDTAYFTHILEASKHLK